ncbi:hypothetical protein BCh11DRAFT_02719 [Burkholderia sp. Ch1-1]|uniref:UPF0276 protein PDMSB3_2805 n=1 Tax=Paraburkholderia dioscoreae TaxID=2604047 RepID=A0A5Q4ZP12_9BURK|nr:MULTISPECIES: DUF692 domain-containing protein [Paraburkholderia]EIF34910.1 hypothetical protein BCh11DRAFT_02719 [Burkholderia sp. Ch1-1]MDR8396529.1 DUF692 domain-containing protein [Paraburkholderia sp. USG1]VVD34089.1 conserved protein of unknown function [Paraburkholderia dioscoreae]
MSESLRPDVQWSLPHRAGVGLKAEHYRTILESQPDIGFFEVHAENYMGAGGPPHRFLSAIRESYPLSLHGVGLSIGADRPLDRNHLERLKELIARYTPGLFSEHLAWSSHDCGFLNDLLPVPYTVESLTRIVDHIDEVQEVLGRQMLLENPSTYLAFKESTYSEIDFIATVARRTGCGLLLDVNNVYVASINQQWDPFAYIDAYPLAAVQEIHLAGHAEEADEKGRPLLIDSHDRHVADIVWNLFARAIHQTGPIPTLIEWDANIPDWPALKAEAELADAVIQAATQPASADHVIRRPQSGMTRRQFKEAQTL